MKNIIKYILLLVLGTLVLSSCDEDLVDNYAAMTNDYDKNNATYYIQYLNASQSFQTEIDSDGLPTDIETTIGVALQGAPQASDVTVTLVVAPENTIPADAYQLSANSITIPAGSTSGSVNLTVLADQMTEDETVNLILNMDAGGAEAATASQLNYALKRIKFCPLEDLEDLAGNWGGFDDWGYPTEVTTRVEDGVFLATGFTVGWMTDYWGEVILDQTELVVTMNPNGTLEIAEQYYMHTSWNGAEQPDYSISGTGLWDNCKKTMVIDYNLHQGGGVLTTFTEDIFLK